MPPDGILRRCLLALRQRLLPSPIVCLAQTERGPGPANLLLLGRNVLVTGAGRNIGRSIALEMAHEGASIYFTDLDQAAVARLQGELATSGTRTRGLVSDVSKASDINALYAFLHAEGVIVDILVNNVGVARGGGLQTLTMADLHAVFDTNVVGPLQLTQYVIKTLIAGARPGTVLFISSVHDRSTGSSLAYAASKAAIAMIVRQLAFELAPHRIRVNGIAPGAVDVNAKNQLPPSPGSMLVGSCIHPSYIGRAAVYLASDYFSQFTTGSMLTVDAGLLTRPQNQ